MKVDKFVKMMLVVIVVLLALNCATGLRGAADAQSSGTEFGYIHFAGDVNLGLLSASSYQDGKEFVDLRNGDAWGFPVDGRSGRLQGNPVYLGTFDFSALDKSVGK